MDKNTKAPEVQIYLKFGNKVLRLFSDGADIVLKVFLLPRNHFGKQAVLTLELMDVIFDPK
jgi:hypothetical protein